MGLSHSPSIVRNGLVLHLDAANRKSYPGTGATWNDLSGNNRNATFVNTGVTYVTSNQGVLDFSLLSYATIPHDSTISSQVFGTSTNFTLSSWVNVRNYINYGPIIAKADFGSYSNSTVGLWAEATNELRLVIGSNVSGNPAGSSTTVTFNATPNTWYNVVGTGDGINGNLYINGKLIGSTPFSAITVARSENTSPITIGNRSTATAAQLDGVISMITVYNRTLSLPEIRQNFQAHRDRYGM